MGLKTEIAFPPFRLDGANEQLRREERLIALRPKTFAVLRYLAEHAGRLVTKEELLHAVWGETQVSAEGLRDYLREIRKALEDNAETPQFIETVRGQGYRFLSSITTQPVASAKLQVPSLDTQHSTLNTEAAPAVLPLPDKPSIIVLPFVNLSNDPEQEYFSDGITEDLTNSLSRISSLFVISRTSAFTYKGKPTKVHEISKAMGVRYVLEGSVRRADNRVRVTVQLIDAIADHHLWAERYDRPLTDVFAVQDETVQKIVTALKIKLTPEEQERFRRAPTDNLEAYDYYLRGLESVLQAYIQTKKEANIQARQMFEHAVELDPKYAGAYTELSLTYFLDWYFRWNPDLQTMEQALELAQRAVVLDESLPLPHLILGYVFVFKQQHDQAIVEAKRAIALSPNEAEGYATLGNILRFAGQPEEAIELIEKATRLNPHYPPWYLAHLAFAYRAGGRYEEALVPLKKVLALTPNFVEVRVNLTACYIELGRLEEAQAEMMEIRQLLPNLTLEDVSRSPYKNPADLERLLAALRKAGLK